VAEKKAEAPLTETLQTAEEDDVIELDEMWSFVQKKANKRWLWVALCRRTRQVVAFFLGDRSEDSCQKLFERIPGSYRSCQSFSDFWAAYQKVFPDETHQSTEKGSGETSRLERWNCHIRQRLARFGRKRLAFSKSDAYHRWVTKWFIHEYNQSVSTSD